MHWTRPTNWYSSSFIDTSWPNATIYSNATIGVDNKPAYTNFTNIFDDPINDAQFIWSTNVILDNEVIVRKTVLSSLSDNDWKKNQINFYPNPAKSEMHLAVNPLIINEIQTIKIYNLLGELVFCSNQYMETISTATLSSGMYVIRICLLDLEVSKKLIIE